MLTVVNNFAPRRSLSWQTHPERYVFDDEPGSPSPPSSSMNSATESDAPPTPIWEAIALMRVPSALNALHLHLLWASIIISLRVLTPSIHLLLRVNSLFDRSKAASRLQICASGWTSLQHTIYDLVQFNAKKWGDTPCFGTRKVIKIHKETTTVIKMVNRVAKKRKLYQCCRRRCRKSSVATSRWPKKGYFIHKKDRTAKYYYKNAHCHRLHDILPINSKKIQSANLQ
jgi:hypothetical protein